MKTQVKTFGTRHPLRRAALFLGSVGGAYAVSSVGLALTGAVPAAPIIAGLDRDNYSAYQVLFALPLVFAVWVLTSGVLLALGTRGMHRSHVLVRAARAWGLPLLLAWIPSAAEAAFAVLGMGQAEWVEILSVPGIWQTLYIGVYAAAAALAVAKFVLAARDIHERSWPAAVLTGLAAAGVALGAFALFVR
jgi:hypothetical protein